MMPKKLIDETGHTYGKLTVIESIRRPNDRKTMWHCVCECGNEVYCSGSDLRTGKRTSCGKHCNSIKNEIGKTYGALTVLKQDPRPGLSFADNSIHWICRCSLCGKEKSVSGKSLRNGDTKSCGCMKSAGEQIITKALNDLGYTYTKEYTYSDLISPYSKLKLRFDFAIFNGNSINNRPLFLIEYQGEQHEREVPYFKHSLEYTQTCDKTKRDYCRDNNIPLIYFTHIGGKTPNYEDVKEYIKETYEEIYNEVFN